MVTAGPNGKPVVSFNGSNQSMNKSAVDILSFAAAQQSTVFLVIRQNADAGKNTIFQWHKSTGERFGTHLSWDDNKFYFDHGTITSGRISGPESSGWENNYHIVELNRNAGNSFINVDAVNVLTGSVSGSLPSGASVIFNIGKGIDGDDYWNGYMADFIIFNRSLTALERKKMNCYLADRYSLTGNLPASYCN